MMGAVAKQRLFVVDDQAQIADALTIVLGRMAEFDVETFYDARSALLRMRDCLPDILVTDVNMPEMDGMALAEALQERNPSCKIILMSGNPYSNGRGDLKDDRLNGFVLLLKPFSIKQLLCHIASEPL